MELRLGVGVLCLQPRDVRVLLGGQEGGRRVDRAEVEGGPRQRLLLGGDLLQVAPVTLGGGLASGRRGGGSRVLREVKMGKL